MGAACSRGLSAGGRDWKIGSAVRRHIMGGKGVTAPWSRRIKWVDAMTRKWSIVEGSRLEQRIAKDEY